MSDSNFSLLNINGLSDVAKKLLEMIEKTVGWTVSPKGARKDFEEAVQYYKNSISENESLPALVKASKMASARKELKQYINQGKIIENSIPELNESADPNDVDSDWLDYFFDYAKNISNESIQLIWGKLLAGKINGNADITKRIIQIFAVIEMEDLGIFQQLCSLSIKSKDRERSIYPFIYQIAHPSYYNKMGIRRYSLASLDQLGLVEYDIHDGFVLPKTTPLLQYGKSLIRLSSNSRINNGNIRFTKAGRLLYGLTEVAPYDDFLEFCCRTWDSHGIIYDISTEEK